MMAIRGAIDALGWRGSKWFDEPKRTNEWRLIGTRLIRAFLERFQRVGSVREPFLKSRFLVEQFSGFMIGSTVRPYRGANSRTDDRFASLVPGPHLLALAAGMGPPREDRARTGSGGRS